MKAKLLSVAVALVALATAAPALASGGAGGAQAALQGATTDQAALGASVSSQNAVNANVPVSIAGGNISAGPSSATQAATSTATTDVANQAKTDQDQSLNQTLGSSGCQAGCGGSGGFQAGAQNAQTQQLAGGAAKSDQNAVNANVPVSIGGGNVKSGPSSATQTASSAATTNVSNHAKTNQDQQLNQNIGGSSCQLGCGGAGGYQAGLQDASTKQLAVGVAKSDQNAVNANVPVAIAGGNVNSGPSSATQTASSAANTNVSNDAKTHQDQSQLQNIGSGCGCEPRGIRTQCGAGCGGSGGFQAGVQKADTNQGALGAAFSDQNAVNGNSPSAVAGGNVSSGPSSATQTASSNAATDVSNGAKTDQHQSQQQNIGGSSCLAGCGGAGGAQVGEQLAGTNQWALGLSKSDQNAVNGNSPSAVAGGNVSSGPSSATQTASSNATTDVSNSARTKQDQHQNQNIGGSSCLVGCGGSGGYQLGVQGAETNQWALGLSKSDENAVNGNSPSAIAGGNVSSGPSSATQTATSNATTDVSNNARTDQYQSQQQNIGNGCGCGPSGIRTQCQSGCGGAGGAQMGAQLAETNQWAAGAAFSHQNAVNANTPVAVAGKNVWSGPSSASQTATSNATTDGSNHAKTDQAQPQYQTLGGNGCGCDGRDPKGSRGGCAAGCGGNGGSQLGAQVADTHQWAAGLALSKQNAVNGNTPHSIAGRNVYAGPSSASQTATSNATTGVSNDARTHQNQWQWQLLGALDD